MGQFEQWFMKVKSTKEGPYGAPMPLLTEILYDICNNEVEKFDRVCDMMELAYRVGQQSKE
jgi:hypothetical protein